MTRANRNLHRLRVSNDPFPPQPSRAHERIADSPVGLAVPKKGKVAFSNVDKVFFPKSKTTKGDIIKYYIDVAPALLPHFRQRPVTLIRFPDGIRGEKFYEKNAPGHAPTWIKTAQVPRSEGGVINYIVINDAETLAWVANIAAIELHPFLHRASHLEQPTHLAFDLDPGEGADLLTCIEVGFRLRDVLTRLGLEAFPKVSGSKGLQLYVPLNRAVTYAEATPFAKAIAELLHREHPDLIIADMSKALRVGKVLIDWSQNHEKKTTVGPYSLRAKREEPFVSMPVTWDELKRAAKKSDADSLFFRPADALKRIKKFGDLFAPVLKLKQTLPHEFVAAIGPTKSKRASSLRRYAEKRDFTKTSEPAPELPKASAQGSRRRFVIQKHAASHLHYDFRLEMDGVLKSWAVPKGLSTEVGVKRSAFQVEDHPLDYFSFEGTIPQGQYGGGTVMVWDIGTYEIIGGNYWRGDLKLWLSGKKLKGEWHLFRIKSEESKPVWLIAKAKESAKPVSAKKENTSVLTGRTLEQIAKAKGSVWQSK
jgi:bifunctional non-homologous end joining protein LigD